MVDLDRLRVADDLYISMNAFRRGGGNRQSENLAAISCSYVDVDYEKKTKWKGQDPCAVLGAILHALPDASVPPPSFAMKSGRGLYLIWLHELLPPAALSRWNLVQDHLVAALKVFSADDKAKDVARVLRIAGSWNRKVGRENPERGRVKLIWIQGDEPAKPFRYEFDDLANEILPFTRSEIVALRAERAKRRATTKGRNGVRPSRRMDSASYGETVLEDLHRLRRHRYNDEDGRLPAGERDGWLFCASMALSWVTHPGALESGIIDLAREVADWKDREAKSNMGAILRRARDAADGKTITFNGQEADPRYRMKAGTIVKWLKITPDEMRAARLRVLLSPEIRKERKAGCEQNRRIKSGSVPHLSKRDARLRIGRDALWLVRKGFTYAQAASELNVSKATIGKAVAEVRRTFSQS